MYARQVAEAVELAKARARMIMSAGTPDAAAAASGELGMAGDKPKSRPTGDVGAEASRTPRKRGDATAG